MKRRCQAVGVLLLMASAGMCAQPAGPKSPKAPPPPRNGARPGAARSPGKNPGGPNAGGSPLLGNPGNPVERLMAMPPEKQAIVARQIKAFNSLPEARRENLKPVLQRLRMMPEARRDALLNSQAFKDRFSASEWQMLAEISQNYPLPGR